MSSWGQLMFQDSASSLMTSLINFHDLTLVISILIMNFIIYMLFIIFMNKFTFTSFTNSQEIETIWAIIPFIMLTFLILPSLRILYLMDEESNPLITIKTIGHQWYWSYEYSDFNNLEFDSYMTPTFDLSPGDFRLLEVDNRLIIPFKTHVRMLISAADVIHSWTIPSIGLKTDAIPGRLNQMSIYVNYPGIYYGQCSEICGANHSFMPISLEVVKMSNFTKWVNKFSY